MSNSAMTAITAMAAPSVRYAAMVLACRATPNAETMVMRCIFINRINLGAVNRTKMDRVPIMEMPASRMW